MPPIKRPTQESVDTASAISSDSEGLPVLLNCEDLAGFLDITIDTARLMCRDGRIPAAKVGRRFKIKREDLIAYMEKQFNLRAASCNP